MSSARGGSFRAGGRGSATPAPRGRGAFGSAGRGNAVANSTPASGVSSRGQRPAPSRPGRGGSNSRRGTSRGNSMAQGGVLPGSRGGVQSKGSWQERYQVLTKSRERERAEAIRQGLIADPEKPRLLSEAVTPVGTCQDMCAEYERVERVVQKDVWPEENDPNRSPFGASEDEPDEMRMVKKFRRAAAGLEEQLPSDLRPPHVLKATCDYLFEVVIGNAQSLGKVHHFVWDRTRAIRNDFSIQQLTKPEELRIAIQCYERIARFHILSLHILAVPEKPYSKYDWQQEREQLDRTLLSLMQYYDDCRGRIELESEAEFRAYCLIFQLQDPTPDLEERIQTWPRSIIENTRVQRALEIYMAACNTMDAQGPLKPRATHLVARQDWQRFWALIGSNKVSYLMACVAEIYFNLVRRTVLNALFRSFRSQSNLATPEWTVGVLLGLLAFDDEDDVFNYCELFGFGFKETQDGEYYLDLSSVKGRTLPEPNAGMRKQMKTNLVEHKRFGRTLPAVINGLSVPMAHQEGMVEEQENDDDMEDATVDDAIVADPSNNATAGDVDNQSDSLFIPDARTETAKTETRQQPATSSLFSGSFASTDHPPPTSTGLSGGFSFGKPTTPSVFAAPVEPKTSAFGSFSQSSPFASAPISTPKTQSIFQASPAINEAPPSRLFNFAGSLAPNAESQAGTSAALPATSNSNTTKAFEASPNKSVFSGLTGSAPSVFSTTQAPPQVDSVSNPFLSSSIPAPSFTFGGSPLAKPQTSLQPFATAQENSSPLFPKQSEVPATPNPTPTAKSSGDFTPSSTSSSASPDFAGPRAQPAPSSPASPPASGTSPPASPTFNTGIKRSSFSSDTRPKKPSPLANSITADEDVAIVPDTVLSSASANQQLLKGLELGTTPVKKQTATASEYNAQSRPENLDSIITRLSSELVLDPIAGYLRQYVEHTITKTITSVQMRLTEERNQALADDFRQYTLARKYGKKWINDFWRRRLAKSGRERRQRRRRLLGEGSEVGSSIFGDSVRSSPSRSISGSRPHQTMGMKEHIDHEFRQTLGRAGRITETDAWPSKSASKRPASSHATDLATSHRDIGHKRMKSTSHIDHRGRVAKVTATSHPTADLLKRSSFLGFSLSPERGGTRSTTKSNYFRLKALGVTPIPDAKGSRGLKRRHSESDQLESRSTSPIQKTAQRTTSIETTARKLQISSPSAERRLIDEEDDALFARLKAAREMLNEGTAFFRTEIAKEEELRQSINSHSSHESPSLSRARAEARMRSSQSSVNDASILNGDVPAYRLRESRFVPRDHYERAIERSKAIRESRSREASQPTLQPDHNFDVTASQPLSSFRPSTDKPSPLAPANAENGFNFTSQPQHQAFSSHTGPNDVVFGAGSSSMFSEHATPFLASDPFSSGEMQPAVGFVSTGQLQPISDYTIKPSQVDESVTTSFGTSHGHSQGLESGFRSSWSQKGQLSTPHRQSQTDGFSFHQTTDNDRSTIIPEPVLDINVQRKATRSESLDETDGMNQGFGHANPYATLADEDGDDEQGSENSDASQAAVANGFESGDEDDEGPYGGDDEEFDEDEEDFSADEEEDEDEEDDASPWHGHSYGRGHDPRKHNEPPQDQGAGGTVEEAIELSD